MYPDKHMHLKFATGASEPLNGLTFKIFRQPHINKDRRSVMDKHLADIHRLINIKCSGDENLQQLLVRSFAKTNKWRKTIQEELKIQRQLTEKQTIIHFKKSKQSLRKYHDQGVYMH
eukprot:537437_1